MSKKKKAEEINVHLVLEKFLLVWFVVWGIWFVIRCISGLHWIDILIFSPCLLVATGIIILMLNVRDTRKRREAAEDWQRDRDSEEEQMDQWEKEGVTIEEF